MRSRLGRPSPALVISIVALFVAMGGTSYAAITITGKNVENSSLTGTDIKNSSLGGSDVKDKSLTPKDFSGSIAGPKGATGATGATGPQGPRGANGTDGTDGTDGSARAFGGVNSNGSRSETIYGNTGDSTFTPRKVATGEYCVAVPGIAPKTTRMIVSADYSLGQPTSALARSSGLGCNSTEFAVVVFNGTALADGGFVFMIP